jgi:hypothetical protein
MRDFQPAGLAPWLSRVDVRHQERQQTAATICALK